MLTLMKQNYCEHPLPLFSTIDMAGNYAFNSYDTLPYINPFGVGPQYVVDGQVRLANMNENDKALMTRLNQWYNEGLIDPGWAGYDNNTLFTDKILPGGLCIHGPVKWRDMSRRPPTILTVNGSDSCFCWNPIRRFIAAGTRQFFMDVLSAPHVKT